MPDILDSAQKQINEAAAQVLSAASPSGATPPPASNTPDDPPILTGNEPKQLKEEALLASPPPPTPTELTQPVAENTQKLPDEPPPEPPPELPTTPKMPEPEPAIDLPQSEQPITTLTPGQSKPAVTSPVDSSSPEPGTVDSTNIVVPAAGTEKTAKESGPPPTPPAPTQPRKKKSYVAPLLTLLLLVAAAIPGVYYVSQKRTITEQPKYAGICCEGGTCKDGWSYGGDDNAPQSSCEQRKADACAQHDGPASGGDRCGGGQDYAGTCDNGVKIGETACNPDFPNSQFRCESPNPNQRWKEDPCQNGQTCSGRSCSGGGGGGTGGGGGGRNSGTCSTDTRTASLCRGKPIGYNPPEGCNWENKQQFLQCDDNSNGLKGADGNPLCGAVVHPGTCNSGGSGGGSSETGCSGPGGQCNTKSCCTGQNLTCQGPSGNKICQQMGNDKDANCGAGFKCDRVNAYKCEALTSSECHENLRVAIGTFQQGINYASPCGQVDEVCSGGSNENHLCGDFEIINTGCAADRGTPAPTAQSTPLAVQCTKLKVYKDNIEVVDFSRLTPGTNVKLAVAHTSGEKARFRVKAGTGEYSAWTETVTRNDKNEFVLDYTLPAEAQTFRVESEVFRGGNWQ